MSKEDVALLLSVLALAISIMGAVRSGKEGSICPVKSPITKKPL